MPSRLRGRAVEGTLRGHARLLALLGEQVTHADVEGAAAPPRAAGRRPRVPARRARRHPAAARGRRRDRGRATGASASATRSCARPSRAATPEALRRRIHLAAARHYRGAAAGRRRRAPPRAARLPRGRGRHRRGRRARLPRRSRSGRARGTPTPTPSGSTAARSSSAASAGRWSARAAYRGRGLMRYRIGRYHDALADFSPRPRDGARAGRRRRADRDPARRGHRARLDGRVQELRGARRGGAARCCAERRSPLARGAAPPRARALGAPLQPQRGGGRAARARRRGGRAARRRRATRRWSSRSCCSASSSQGLGRLDDARRALDRAIALCEAHGDRLHLGAALNNRALLWGYLGDKARMVADMERALVARARARAGDAGARSASSTSASTCS